MAYKPSLNDIEHMYSPSLADIEDKNLSSDKYSAASYLANANLPNKSGGRYINPHEEYSNPTQYPGFENLPQKEKLARIAFSQFDPANQTLTGGFVPPGSFESDPVRLAITTLPTLAAPELRVGAPIIRGIANILSRVGVGTAGNVSYQSPNIKNMEDLKNIVKESVKSNALMEVPVSALKGARGAAEIYNPSHRYATQRANQIQQEATAARQLQRETFQPVFQQYGNTPVTHNSNNFMANAGIERRHLYPEARKLYDEFLAEPIFQNLHNLQSRLGADIRKVNIARNKPLTEQRFTQYRNALKNEAETFLSRDQNALNQYNLGSQITRDLVEPFNANATLKQISRGTRISPTPQQISNAIKKGREKIVYERGGNMATAIPENHPLNRHFNEINNRLDISKGLKDVTPNILKGFLPNVGGAIQNQLLNRLMESASPLYYGAGRGLIGYNSGNK